MSSIARSSFPSCSKRSTELRNEVPSDQLPKHIDAVAGDGAVSVAVRNPAVKGHNAPTITRRIGNETYEFSAEGFFQVNHDLLETMIDTALGDAAGKTAVDLYCGVGLFTLPLARRFERVIGVEANPLATDFARRNLHAAGLELRGSGPIVREILDAERSSVPASAEIVTARVGDWLQQQSALSPVDFLLLDPPRTGAENKDIAGILKLRPRRISYVSCDPATLARDLKKLIAGGYSLDSVTAFDMFPQTHHVETIARLSATSV